MSDSKVSKKIKHAKKLEKRTKMIENLKVMEKKTKEKELKVKSKIEKLKEEKEKLPQLKIRTMLSFIDTDDITENIEFLIKELRRIKYPDHEVNYVISIEHKPELEKSLVVFNVTVPKDDENKITILVDDLMKIQDISFNTKAKVSVIKKFITK